MTYDVFVSFHDDTRKNFTAFLFQALSANGIDAFRYNGEKGESVTHEVLKAIQGSGIFVVVFSKNYASSTWCLRELTEICNCVETLQRLVLPIFYDVDPLEVRKQSGCYKEAFAKHVEKLREDKEKLEELQRWRESLTQVANLYGWDIRNEIERAEGVYMQIEEAFAKYVEKFRENGELMEELQSCRESLTQMANLSGWDIINITAIERAEGVYMQIEEAIGKHVEKFRENKELMEELQRWRESLTQMANLCGWDIINKIERSQRVCMQIHEESFAEYVEKFRKNEELMEELQRCRESLAQMAIFGDWDIIDKIEPVLIKEVVEAVLRKVPPLPQKLPPRYRETHDVFLSFRGEDTRLNFTSHLHKALTDEQIKSYMDNQLQKGDEISQALIEAIEDSYVSIVIFSKNYASSKWCLGELSKILECKKAKKQIVIPVFYNTDPSHVRRQTESYKEAFANHEGDPRCNKWRSDLTEAANLAGWDSRNRDETELIKGIVKDVRQKLDPMYPNQRKQPIGIEQTYEKIESLLKIGSSEGPIRIGIWGMGGIGKTTLARTLYDNLSCKFEGCWFLENVRERSNKNEDLCDQLFSGLSKNNGFGNFEIVRLQRKKVFIVLDDVATSEQLDKLIYEYDDFLGPGSRVIVTARDKQILAKLDEIYQVEELSSDHSLQLFCSNAFVKEQPEDGFEDLSSRVVSYCKGIPLALKVLGASLYKKHERIWESKLRKLGKIQNLEIHKVLKLSYDGLDPYEQGIFLDIACFFKGWHKDRLTSLLKACGFHPESEIDTLLDKSLITISDNRIEMHDLIQEMGWQIVDEEDIKDPGKRSRLWRHGEVLDALKCNKGTTFVEGIIFDLCKLTRNLSLSSSSLANMTNMRCLMIHDSSGRSDGFKVCLPNGESSLSDKLRCLYWDGFCLESLPPTFCAEHLVELRMRDSNNLKKLWDGVQDLVNLKTIDLSYSRNLIEIPDLSKADKLESVYLIDCESLCQLHIQSTALCVVRLDGCSSLKKFSMTSVEITELNLDNTAVCALPPSIWCSRKLVSLSLKGRKDLTFVESIGYLSSLKELDLSGTDIIEISPKIFEKLSMLERLRLNDCDQLKSLPELPISLQEVSAVNCTSLDTEITQQLVLLHMLHNQSPRHVIFPGSHLFKKCEFPATKNSITIDCLPKSNKFRGMIYCFILSKHGKGFRTIPVSCSIYQQGDIQIVRDYKAIACGSNLISDHVLFSYVDIGDRISEVGDKFSVIFEFDHYDETIELRHDQRIKEYALFPVYAIEKGLNELIESMAVFNEPQFQAQRMAIIEGQGIHRK